MIYRSIEMSGQGHRWDIVNPNNRRICIAHSEKDAGMIVKAMNALQRKEKALAAGFEYRVASKPENKARCCATCQFHLPSKKFGYVECHRNAPLYMVQYGYNGNQAPGVEHWPEVKSNDFCGEWGQKYAKD